MMGAKKQQINEAHLNRKMLIVDTTIHKYAKIKNKLADDGWEVHTSNDKKHALAIATNFQPEVIIINLFMQNSSTIKLIRDMRAVLKNVDVHIIVVTSHYSEENIRQSIKAGATDFIIEPFESHALIERIRFQMQEKASYKIEELESQSSDIEADFKLLYECLRILSEMKSSQTGIFETLRRIADYCHSPRVNIMMADLESPKAVVISSSDDPDFMNARVELDRYPEVREVLLKHNIIFIKDITSNPLTADIQSKVKSINIQSLLVLPIRHRGETFGTMSIRLSDNSKEITDSNLKTFFMLAMCLAPKIAAKKLLASKGK